MSKTATTASINDFLSKIENIKLLKEFFALQTHDIRYNIKNNIDVSKTNPATMLSIEIMLENIQTLSNLIERLTPTLETKNKETKNNIDIQKFKKTTENIIRLDILSNFFATEFLFLTKKFEADLKKNKRIPIELKDEIKKVKFDLSVIKEYILDIKKIVEPVIEKEKDSKKKELIKKKHKGFLTTAVLVKKRLIFAEKIELLSNKKLKNKYKSLPLIEPIKFFNENNIKVDEQLINLLKDEHKVIEIVRNEVLMHWQVIVEEVISYAASKYSYIFERHPEVKNNLLNDLKQFLRINLLNGLNLLNFPQKKILYDRLRAYIDSEFKKIADEKKNEKYFSDFAISNFDDEENNRDEFNNIYFFTDKKKFQNYHELTAENILIKEEENITNKPEFWKDVIKFAKQIKLHEEANYLQEYFLNSQKKKKEKGFLDFYKDYNKRKIKGSLGLLIKFVEAKHILHSKNS